ncbi:TY-Chap domain-containing protein [Angustibacter sp. McL0619]|uniref:TY-Chap domain-containing protein n=1 Tax=Angustibacter sp. McL0619 TaxID=3415676 RepID=UPI003CEA835A
MPDDASQAEAASRWNVLAYGLGQLINGLADLDFATFAVDDRVVMTITRDASDVWILASGPHDEVEPVELSPPQRDILSQAGFSPPLSEAAERAAQRTSWWLRLPASGDASTFDTAGHTMISALRDVYGANHPEAVEWQGLALSDGSRSVLDALPLTRSPSRPR